MDPTLTMFFDGACHLCSREAEHYRRQDREGRVAFVDISAPGFDAQALGLDPREVNRHLHVRRSDGSFASGVDAFIEIWRALPGWRWAARVGSAAPARLALRGAYAVFAELRPYLPRRKSEACEGGACDVRLGIR